LFTGVGSIDSWRPQWVEITGRVGNWKENRAKNRKGKCIRENAWDALWGTVQHVEEENSFQKAVGKN